MVVLCSRPLCRPSRRPAAPATTAPPSSPWCPVWPTRAPAMPAPTAHRRRPRLAATTRTRRPPRTAGRAPTHRPGRPRCAPSTPTGATRRRACGGASRPPAKGPARPPLGCWTAAAPPRRMRRPTPLLHQTDVATEPRTASPTSRRRPRRAACHAWALQLPQPQLPHAQLCRYNKGGDLAYTCCRCVLSPCWCVLVYTPASSSPPSPDPPIHSPHTSPPLHVSCVL